MEQEKEAETQVRLKRTVLGRCRMESTEGISPKERDLWALPSGFYSLKVSNFFISVTIILDHIPIPAADQSLRLTWPILAYAGFAHWPLLTLSAEQPNRVCSLNTQRKPSSLLFRLLMSFQAVSGNVTHIVTHPPQLLHISFTCSLIICWCPLSNVQSM